MKNEVFKNVTQIVEAFQADYQAKLQAAEDQLQQETKKKNEAEAKAAAAVAADDQTTWKKADKDRIDAAAGIKYAQERLAMIQKQRDFPLADFGQLRDQIEAEQGRATLAFIEDIQKLYSSALVLLDKLQTVHSEARAAAAKLYAAGGSEDEGYTRISENKQANWTYLVESGKIFNKKILDAIDNPDHNEAVHRAASYAAEAIRRTEGK